MRKSVSGQHGQWFGLTANYPLNKPIVSSLPMTSLLSSTINACDFVFLSKFDRSLDTMLWCNIHNQQINTLHHRRYQHLVSPEIHLTSPGIYLSTMFAPWCLLGLLALVSQAAAHGRLVEPPSRFSAWRLGFSTPAYYNDSETNCGGFERHQVSNGGKCGICGDPWDEPRPRRVSWDFDVVFVGTFTR